MRLALAPAAGDVVANRSAENENKLIQPAATGPPFCCIIISDLARGPSYDLVKDIQSVTPCPPKLELDCFVKEV